MIDSEGRRVVLEETDRKLMEAIRDAILLEVHALRDITKQAMDEIRIHTERIEEKHEMDTNAIYERINAEVKRRDEMVAALHEAHGNLTASIEAWKQEITKVAVRVLVGIIVTLGVPIGGWFLAQIIHLIITHSTPVP